jgi:formylglycine-generating enzyme required for sulfatase activity
VSVKIAENLLVDFCWVPSGEFIMGSPKGEAGRQENEDQVRVRISKGFWIGKTEVTNAQWNSVMGNLTSRPTQDQLPVVSVSWVDCIEFLSRLKAPPKGWVFTLPSEAQWEYACRGGTKTAYAGILDEMGWHFGNTSASPKPVGLKKPNSFGVHDMHGNVFEWCRDAYTERLRGGLDPLSDIPGEARLRVRRGGSWYYRTSACRSAYRLGDAEDFKTGHLGFRLALVRK